jgi:hypothetical protein
VRHLLRLLGALPSKNPQYLHVTRRLHIVFRTGSYYFYTHHLQFGVWEEKGVWIYRVDTLNIMKMKLTLQTNTAVNISSCLKSCPSAVLLVTFLCLLPILNCMLTPATVQVKLQCYIRMQFVQDLKINVYSSETSLNTTTSTPLWYSVCFRRLAFELFILRHIRLLCWYWSR